MKNLQQEEPKKLSWEKTQKKIFFAENIIIEYFNLCLADFKTYLF